MERAALRRLLLDLIGTTATPGADVLPRLSPADWQVLDELAAAHRLQPLLHAAHRDNAAIPGEVRASWHAAHRVTTLTALAQHADMVDTVALLRGQGFDTLVLKGGWLAWRAYPEPALRPLRDIDLLVPVEAVLPAFEALRGAGYALDGAPEMAIEDIIRLDKHMPVLLAPRGTRIELHHRLWEHEGRLDSAVPRHREGEVFARAARDGALAYPRADDMLAHLVIHAIYSHRLDCGPLVLSDIDYLLRCETIDWTAFWTRAEADGWADGAALLLELTRRYRDTPGLVLPAERLRGLPPRIVDLAADLLLQELGTRRTAALAAAALGGNWRLVHRALTGKRLAAGEAAQRDFAGEGGLVRWASSRFERVLGELRHREVREQARLLARFSRFLGRAD